MFPRGSSSSSPLSCTASTSYYCPESHQLYFYALPWQRPLEEIDQHVGECLEIISSGLLYSQVAVEAGVSDCPSDVLILFVGDVY